MSNKLEIINETHQGALSDPEKEKKLKELVDLGLTIDILNRPEVTVIPTGKGR